MVRVSSLKIELPHENIDLSEALGTFKLITSKVDLNDFVPYVDRQFGEADPKIFSQFIHSVLILDYHYIYTKPLCYASL